MDWLELIAFQNGWSLLALGILDTILVCYLLFIQWEKYPTRKQRKAFLYPFVFLSWLSTGYLALGTVLFQHYLMAAILVGCLVLQIVLFLHRIRTESATQD